MLKIDAEFKALIPPLTDEEFAQLEKNCIAEGIRDPIILWEDTIVDGHNRFKIAQKHDLKFNSIHKRFGGRDEVIDWMINNQLGRRNLSKDTQSYLRGLQYKREKKRVTNPYGVKGKDEGQNEHHLSTAQKLAEQYKVDESTIKRDEKFADAVDTIVSNTSPEVKHKILNQDIKINKEQAKKLAKQKPEKQKAIIEKLVNKEAESFVDANRLIKKEEVHETPKIKGKYRVIYADPPWSYGDKLTDGYGTAENHYPTMPLKEICELPIQELAEDSAVLFLWVTSPLIQEGLEVVKAWGFKYKAMFVWDKVKHNMGHYNSVRHELLLICTRGSCLPDNKKLYDSVQSIERTNKHSEKPEEFRSIIDDIYTTGNRIELFSRTKAEGWSVWGNQI
jgi:N6-adenosine-specific RNA methylase IME4